MMSKAKRKATPAAEPSPADLARGQERFAKLAAKSLLARESAAEFQGYFRVPLRKYWHNVFGFDVTTFDTEVVKSGDNESMADAITRNYGAEATALIRKLIA